MKRLLPFRRDEFPSENFPYNFKKRLSNLASLTTVKNLRQTCPEFRRLCYHRPEKHDQVYITDNTSIYRWAKKKLFIFQFFKFIYTLFRLHFDGYSFRPTWQSVLYIDHVVLRNRPIFVTDTLVVNCHSIAAFETLIPYICGPFTRLMIHGGNITLDQVKRLKLPTVKVIEVNARIKLDPEEHAEVVKMVKQHIRGIYYKFTFCKFGTYPSELWSTIENGCRENAHLSTPEGRHVVDMFLVIHNFLIAFGTYLLYQAAVIFSHDYKTQNSPPSTSDVLLLCSVALLPATFAWLFLKSTKSTP
uniref:CbamoylP_synth_lsu-like_ATP-bd domain-containing protein n=1 Tax=Panagrellus redivivus TaxID=6233 RepID=A0A7E4V525_PANRE